MRSALPRLLAVVLISFGSFACDSGVPVQIKQLESQNCLVPAVSPAVDGTGLLLEACTTINPEQNWTVTPLGLDAYQIKHFQSGFCIDEDSGGNLFSLTVCDAVETISLGQSFTISGADVERYQLDGEGNPILDAEGLKLLNDAYLTDWIIKPDSRNVCMYSWESWNSGAVGGTTANCLLGANTYMNWSITLLGAPIFPGGHSQLPATTTP